MHPDILQSQLKEILENAFQRGNHALNESETLSLNEQQMFRLWNLLGEELGIDLSLVTEEDRKRLFEECQNGKHLAPKEFGSLLWLMYYSSNVFQ